MSIQKKRNNVETEVSPEIPDSREYDTEENADVDRKLCDAIDAAEAAGDEYLSKLLALELESHYYGTR